MDRKEKNNDESLPPSYDETVGHRKKSTISIISQPYSVQKSDYQEHKNEIRNSESKSESHKISINDASNQAKDSLFFVLITITILGVVHHLPLSFFGMANEYWMYKFRNTTSNSTDPNERTYLQVNFSALSGIITIVPTVICNFLLTFVGHNFKATTRIMVTLMLHSVIIFVEVIFVNVNTDGWQEKFFILTATSMVFVQCSISFGAAGQYGLIPKLPPIYMKNFLLGGGIADVFIAVIRLISVAASPSATTAANIYFGTASLLFFSTTLITFFAMKTRFFRHYTTNTEVNSPKIRTSSDIKDVLICIWSMILLNVFLLAIPSGTVSNLVVSEYENEKGNVWANQYFITVCSYLIPSLTNMTGRAIYNKLDWNWPMPAIFVLVIMYQVVNTVTIYLSNALPRHHLPVLFKHDWEYAVAMAIHGLAIGFIFSMTAMKSIRMVPPEKTELAMVLLYFTNSLIQAICSPLGIVAVKII